MISGGEAVSAGRSRSAFASRPRRIAFSWREKTPPPFEIDAAVEILPARARQVEKPPALGVGRFGIRLGIDEDIAVVEGGDELGRRQEQHGVAEDIAGHVADARRR